MTTTSTKTTSERLNAWMEVSMSVDTDTERRLNHRAFRRLKARIDRAYPAQQFVAIVRGQIVADAPTFDEVLAAVESIETDPERRFIVQAGVENPTETLVL